MQTPVIEAEIQTLAQRWGTPARHEVVLTGQVFDPLTKSDRYGEVCMVIRRPNGKLLTAIKTFYPRGAYRLLTGGVNHAEQIIDALLRETAEETSLEVNIRRFLAVVDYRRPDDPADQPVQFSSFAFLLDETGGTLHVNDPEERHESFREIDVAELPAMADFLATLTGDGGEEIGGRWSDWGIFRSAIHRAVYQALSEAPTHG